MKITVFTSNQSRHLSFINTLKNTGAEVFCVTEVNTVHPGLVNDFYKKSDVFREYFRNVLEAEKYVFGEIHFLKGNINVLPVKMSDLSQISLPVLDEALHSDIYIVFGASWIRGDLVDFLIEKKALNIHMGVSPFYRGTACNFWASYDDRPEMIGATIHYLSKGLDSGPILFHALPEAAKEGRFLTGMRAVKAAHLALADMIKTKEIFHIDAVKQDKSKELRYSKNADFNDIVAKDFLEMTYNEVDIFDRCKNRDLSLFLNPKVY